MEEIVRQAKQYNRLLVDDCAQASDRGDSDVTLLRFGPVKTATATNESGKTLRKRL